MSGGTNQKNLMICKRERQMANTDLTVDVYANISISEEAVKRCLKLLDMWQEDNPEKYIERKVYDGEVHYEVCVR